MDNYCFIKKNVAISLLLLLLLLLNQHFEFTYGVPFKHFGRCKVGTEDAFCVEVSACKETTISISSNSVFREKCTSTVVENLICCLKNPSANPLRRPTPKLQPDILPEPPECGHALTDRIAKGETTHVMDYPWMALLRYTLHGIDYSHDCGGSLIGDRWVLTAAHCVINDKISSGWRLVQARLGEWNTATSRDCENHVTGPVCAPPHRDVDIDQIIPHEDYSSALKSAYVHDIALLRLRERVEKDLPHIMPICLPPASDDAEHNFENVVMDISGWGNTEHTTQGSAVKQVTSVRVLSHANCRNIYHVLSDTQLCARGKDLSTSCHGDSGGPLISIDTNKKRDKSYYVMGIISLGVRTCTPTSFPVIFTRVENYINWIHNKVSENS